MDDSHFDKIEGNVFPGSHVEVHLRWGEVIRGYVYIPQSNVLGRDPVDVQLEGHIQIPRFPSGGKGADIPEDRKLEDFLLEPAVERLVVTEEAPQGYGVAWKPVCPECDAVGVGAVTPNYMWGEEESKWTCSCGHTMDEPERRHG